MPRSSEATDLLPSLPLPLAQVLVRALNARSELEAHHRAYDLGEASLKLLASARLGLWLAHERSSAAVRLERLRHATGGHWVALLREAGRALRSVTALAGHTLVEAIGRHRTRPAVRRWAEAAQHRALFGPDQVRHAASGGLEGVFGLLVSYRNQVLGHGAQRDLTFYGEMGPLLREAVCEILREERPLGQLELAVPLSPGDWLGLTGVVGLPLDLEPSGRVVEPGQLYLVGHGQPISLHPLAIVRRQEGRERVAFLIRASGPGSRARTAAEYLDYTTGETIQDESAGADLQLLLAGRATGSAPPAQAAPAPARGHNLPHTATSFVGRRVELSALHELLSSRAPLVTIVGPGGTGKTRLAVELARDALDGDELPGGAWFCDLTEARNLDGVCNAVAGALDVPLTQRDPVEQLGNAILGRGRVLLVLDNVEQVADAVTQALREWLERAPLAVFVATSRELLRIGAERALPLEPLPVPPSAARTVEALRDNDAVQLLVDRARASRPRFEVDATNAGAIGELVHLLDGLPLAIELAAARLRILTPAQIVTRLSRRFDLLGGTRRDVTDRQATLRGAIDWSWDLLKPWEKGALVQCSVFRGGFTIEAAEAVLDLDPWPDAPSVLDALQALADKSLLRAGLIDPAGRFGMYASIQEYTAEKLAGAAGSDAVQERHAVFYARLGTDEALEALREADAVGFAELLLERDNLAAAVAHACRVGRSEHAPAALALWEILQRQGPVRAGREHIQAVVALPSLAANWRVRLLRARAHADIMMGQHDSAGATLDEALRLARARQDRRQEGRLLGTLGDLFHQQGRFQEAREHVGEALDIAREVGDRRREGIGLGYLGIVCQSLGLRRDARGHYEQALAILQDVGDRKAEGYYLCALGNLLAEDGELEASRQQLMAALEAAKDARDRRLEGYVLDNLGVVERRLGQLEQALSRHQAALSLAREVGDRRLEGYNLASLAQLDLDAARLDEAQTHLDGAQRLAHEVRDGRLRLQLHCHRGRLALLQGRREEGARELDAALLQAQALGDPHLVDEIEEQRRTWLAG